ncbi:peptidase domain-containing ABC transporter [soil metagenome]
MDCGPACIQMIAKFYGRLYSLNYLRTRTFLTRQGVSLLSISETLETIGFRTLSAKVSFIKLQKDAQLPCIAHWRQNHFIVVYKINKAKVFVADPSSGIISYSHDEFKKGWEVANFAHPGQGIALLLEPLPAFYEMEVEKSDDNRKNITYLFGYLRIHGKLVTQLILGLLTASLIQLILPFLTQSIVDVGINTHNINFIYLALAAQMMLFISRMSVDFIRRWILLHLSTRISISLISDFLSKLFKLPMPFFEGKMIGDILRRIEDHSRIERLLSISSLSILFSFFNLIVFGLVLAVYDILIFGVFLTMSTLYVAFVLLFMKRRAGLDHKRFQQLANNQSNLIQMVQGMNEIKMNNCETRKRWEWERIQAKLFAVNIDSNKLQQYQDAGSIFLNESKNMIITALAALAVINGSMTLGMMLAVQYIIGQLNSPIQDFIVFTRDWQDAKISLQRVGEIHGISNEDELETISSDQKDLSGTLILQNVSFQYEGPHSPKVLDNIDLIIPEGKVTAIVGTSGSGKTTLMKLLLKFYKPNDGKITLDGENLQSLRSRDWRQNCGVVMQDGYLFSDTIAQNIALSDEVPNRKKLQHAVSVANIEEFIEALPLGYSTKIGANGVGLSQGQKQRLLIARAVYKNPQMIFFDEATSSLDANNEKTIMEKLDKFFKGKTVLVIVIV